MNVSPVQIAYSLIISGSHAGLQTGARANFPGKNIFAHNHIPDFTGTLNEFTNHY